MHDDDYGYDYDYDYDYDYMTMTASMTGLCGTSSQALCPGLGPTEERTPFPQSSAYPRPGGLARAP